MVVRCNGGVNICFGIYLCGDDGCSWCIFSSDDVFFIFSKYSGDVDSGNCWSFYCNFCGFYWFCVNRYKEGVCLFYS